MKGCPSHAFQVCTPAFTLGRDRPCFSAQRSVGPRRTPVLPRRAARSARRSAPGRPQPRRPWLPAARPLPRPPRGAGRWHRAARLPARAGSRTGCGTAPPVGAVAVTIEGETTLAASTPRGALAGTLVCSEHGVPVPGLSSACRSRFLSPGVWLRPVAWLSRVMGSFEAVEDQVEAELVLAAEVVAGLKNMPEGELGEVGVLVGGELRHLR